MNFATQHFICPPAEHLLGAFVPGRQAEVLIGGHDRVLDVLEQMGLVAKLLLVLLALGYVPEIDSQATFGRIGVDLYPYALPRVELLEMYGSTRRHRSMVLSVGGQSHGFWERLPQVLPQEFFACS